VVVVASPHFALLEDKGAFKIADVPEGKGTLKVWSHGRWVHEEPLEIGGRALELQIKPAGGGAKESE
jgi:hypothetical protein